MSGLSGDHIHYLTLFGKTAEAVTRAKTFLGKDNSQAFVNYDQEPEESWELAHNNCLGYPVPCFALTLRFALSGEENYFSVKRMADDMYSSLNEAHMVITGSIDSTKGRGYNKGFAYLIVLG